MMPEIFSNYASIRGTTVMPYFQIMSKNLCGVADVIICGFNVQIILLRKGCPVLLVFLIRTCLTIFYKIVFFMKEFFEMWFLKEDIF
jgi:hypothetical protein